MTRMPYPLSRRFLFEMRVEVSDAFAVSSGELAALITDGLMSLDQRGELFPGATTPEAGRRLQEIAIGAIGYAAWRRSEPENAAYRRLMNRYRAMPRSVRQLHDRLKQAVETLESKLLHQRLVVARMQALVEKSEHPKALTDADRTIAEDLLNAAGIIGEAVEKALKPVL